MSNAGNDRRMPWWAMALIGSLGAFAPQLCNFIPNAAGNVICQFVVKIGVNAFAPGAPSAPVVKPAVDCPPDRLTSAGTCLPPAAP